MSFQKYSNYVESNSLWLPEHPTHWKVVPLGSLISRRKLKNRSDLPLLSVLREKGVVPRALLSSDENHNYIPDDLSNYRVALNGDLVVNKMKAWQGSVGIAPIDGIVSPAYFVFSIKGVTKGYAHRLLRSRLYADYFARASDGVRIGQWDLSIDQMKRIPVLLPPNQEQDQIVAYLRAQDAQIARFIKTKRDLIKLLTEQKLCIIDHAVARGLDASVALKQSGIEWLGEVPEHWELSKLGACIRTNRAGVWGSDPSDKNLPDQLICVRVADFDMEKLAVGTSKLTVRAVSQNERSGRLLCSGDILLEKSGGGEKTPVGRVVAFTLDKVSVCSNFLARLVPNTQLVRSAFLLTLMNHLHARRIVIPYIKQTTGIQNLDSTAYFKLGIALPSLDEQDEILQALAQECKPIEEAIQRANEEIKLIREYRDRLIADVVTGQVDVRGWQPGPDDVVDDAALVALGDENEDVTEEEDGDGED